MTPKELKEKYLNGDNITHILRELYASKENTDAIIELAYDLQSGNYVKGMKDEHKTFELRDKYIEEVMTVIKEYTPAPKSFFKGGVGEAVTLTPMLQKMSKHIEHVYGVDMCWSRLAHGKKWLKENNLSHVNLAMGTLSDIPFENNAFEVVVTSHSMEPNGGREQEILQELYRIAGRYLFLCEPCYEIACDEGRDRMDRLGYVKKLQKTAEELGYKVIDNVTVKNTMNPLNPTAILIIEKGQVFSDSPQYACPSSKTKLQKYQSCYYSEEMLCAYPIIEGIPSLRKTSAVICSQLPEINLANSASNSK